MTLSRNILVLCTGNSCRSQMAEGYLRYFANGKANIYSAGLEAHGLNPDAIRVMALDGIDISGHQSNLISDFENMNFECVITVCDNAYENCPVFPSKSKKFHKNFHDPSKSAPSNKESDFLKVRAEIKEYCRIFVEENL